MTLLDNLRRRAKALKTQLYALALATVDPRVPWTAKLLALAVVGYAFSPIDLIPDFIPVLGLLDDLILLPFGIAMVIKLIPPDVLADLRMVAEAHFANPQQSKATWVDQVGKVVAVLIVCTWILLIIFAIVWIRRQF